IRAICENDSNHICYPVIDFSFKETKNPSDTDTKKSINSLKIIEGIDDLFSDSKRLNPLINICPNKTPSTYNKIVNTLEFIVISSSQRERDRTYHLLQDLEKLYNTVYKKINTNKNVFQTSNSNLISWYYRSLTKEFPALGLSVTESTDKQKQTILCIFDVLCATTEPNQFTKLEAKLTERFGRKERELNQSKEEKTLTFSEADWAKLSQIAGSQSKSQIKAKLKELIDNELLSIEL
ncbi:hypothetical protein NB464_08030, partial [Vibrio diabolicus]